MAVKTTEEIIQMVADRIGEDTSDEAIGFLEDISDTLADRDARIGVDWEQRYNDLDAEWRRRYTERFTRGVDETIIENKEEETEDLPEKTKFEELFTEEKGD